MTLPSWNSRVGEKSIQMLYGGTVGVKFAGLMTSHAYGWAMSCSPLKKQYNPLKKEATLKTFKMWWENIFESAKRLLKMIHGLSEWGYDCGYSRADIGVQIFSGHRISDTHLLQTLWSEALSWLLKRSRLSKMSTIREKIPFYITWHVIIRKIHHSNPFLTWLPIHKCQFTWLHYHTINRLKITLKNVISL